MSASEEIIQKVLIYIEKKDRGRLTVEDIAHHVYVSPAYLQCLFKESYGIGLAEYVRKKRLKLSCEMLQNTEKSVSDIAYEVGFAHESSFIRAFKKEFGITPGKARQKRSV